MAFNIRKTVFFALLFIPLCAAVRGVNKQCCELAKSESAFINNSVSQEDYVCGQRFLSGLLPAPKLSVTLAWCRENCGDYALYRPTETSAWALPLLQFILPAVIFSQTIPRRLGARTPRLPLVLLPVSLVVDALILVLDTAAWVFTIMMATAPLILSGLFEIIIDYRVTRYTSPALTRGNLERRHVVELLATVLAGNLGTEGVPANPQQELNCILEIKPHAANSVEETQMRLRGMLECQVAFGVTVGTPVLLYIGSFIYSLTSLSDARGDIDTARALAFGIWWMTIVHVSAISGSLLASNNPSTAAAIYGRSREQLNRKERYGKAKEKPEMEDRIQANLETFSRLPLVFKTRYEPVWMWTRGKNKAVWLRHTGAWQQEWFSEKMRLSLREWILLTLASYFLVFLPSAFAFWVEYTTPPVGLGCRALTVLVYAIAQFIFVILSAWSHFKAAHGEEYWKKHPWLSGLRRESVGICVTVVFLVPAWLASMFTTFAGTLMQISGIYQNCLCAATFPPHATVSLASDTQEDRDASSSWVPASYVAIGVLFVVTYGAWWCQRFLRDVFIDRVSCLSHEDNYLPLSRAVMPIAYGQAILDGDHELHSVQKSSDSVHIEN